MNIIMMGPKGAGKTSVGIALAEILGRPWVDTDRIIEELDGKGRSCREIFSVDGEQAFRVLERRAAQQASEYVSFFTPSILIITFFLFR